MTTKRTIRTGTQTGTLTQTQSPTAPLTHEEELVIRMRRGLSEGPGFALEMRGQGNPDLRDMLRQFEARAIAAMRMQQQEQVEPPVRVDAEASAKIVDRLSRLKG